MDVITAVIVFVALALAGKWLSAEADWVVQGVREWLIKKAAEELPSEYQERYRSEWLQVIADTRSPTLKTKEALWIFLRASRMAGELLSGTEPRKSSRAVRFLDLSISVAGLLSLSPLLLTIGVVLKCSGGPVFVRVRFHTASGLEFSAWKFRTLAAEGSRSVRFVKIEAFLRRTSFDELPLLLSVVTGDMALFGPRPERSPPKNTADARDHVPGLVTPADSAATVEGLTLKEWRRGWLKVFRALRHES